MAKDYYERLEVDKSASADEIKSAYRKLAKKYHPDMNKDDDSAAQKFKEINEAYQVLSDDQKRQQYDQFGEAAFNGQQGAYQSGGFEGFGGFDFSDIFDFFGGGASRGTRQQTGPQKGQDIRVNMTLSFEDAAFGIEKEITLNRTENCPACDGSGAQKGTSRKTCTACNGTGQQRVQQQTVFGAFASVQPCQECGGEGTIVEQPCEDCRGRGTVTKQRKIKVNIPAGIDSDQIITMRGEGNAGKRGGPAGDLRIYVNVKPHKLFVRDGYDLYLDLNIGMVQAAAGAELQVPTLDGKVKYNIPEGTQPNTVFRLKGKGIKNLNSSRYGDLYVRARVEIPKKISEKQKQLLKEFDKKSKPVKNEYNKPKELFR
ncbi:MAG: molecular chaperone DnaJ [Christensenellaceae bacterium]